RGAPFTFSTSVNANTASSVIAWVDFNNDGKFQLNEAAYATSTAATAGYQPVTGESIVHFWFRGEQTSRIPVGATQLYSRIR
ncbi:GEVED domain-containing protein, partial [Bacillus sp. SIMBA_031]